MHPRQAKVARRASEVIEAIARWPSMIERDPRTESSLNMNEIRGIVDQLRKGMPRERLLQTYGAKKHHLTEKDLDGFLLMHERGLLK